MDTAVEETRRGAELHAQWQTICEHPYAVGGPTIAPRDDDPEHDTGNARICRRAGGTPDHAAL